MADFVTDTFTGAASSTLQSHVGQVGATWTKHPASGQDMVLTDANMVRATTTGPAYGLYYASGVPPSADYDVSARVTTRSFTLAPVGICGRVDPASQTCYFAQYGGDVTNGLFELKKVVAGVETTLGTYVQTIAPGNSVVMTLMIRDGAKKLLINGVVRISSPDNTIAAAGRVGIKGRGQNNNTTGYHLDDFSAAPGAPLPPVGVFTNMFRSVLAPGKIGKQGVYRGTSDGTEKFYLTHIYSGGIGDLVAIDPLTNYSSIAYPFPTTDEGAWSMAYHPIEKNLYLGTFLGANILQFNTTTQALVNLGHVTGAGSTYVWDMQYSPYNQKIYGVCSDGTLLFRMDGTTIVSLGEINATSGNSYARWLGADPNPAQPYLYIGVGVNASLLFSYNINTGVKTQLASTGGAGAFTVDRQQDGTVYAFGGGQFYTLSGGVATAAAQRPNFEDNVFANGNTIDVSSGTIIVTGTFPDDTAGNVPLPGRIPIRP